ncbi:MAG: ADP-ribosylglycohydrolase [Cellvibrionaceae bacterium]|jgi:ADP-ribosylglycohydrolase
MSLPENYSERVYAGILGKIIGVYLGRPFEGWDYARIMRELGEIDGYVNHKIPGHPPIVVTDDDITGTFTFLRAFDDYGCDPYLTPAQIGQTWLNYIIENKTILWWGGLGNSTEHTAFMRLKNGITAPASGSAALNGKTISEQIGAQIFIDGWGMIAPGDPAFAADLARRAGSVSHDGEAVYGAQVLAAMVAQAFVEKDINSLIDCGTSFIPQDSTIYKMIADIREWHAAEPDWHIGRQKLAEVYNYETFGGVCHIMPNHALIILALLYGNDSFSESLKIVNTAGWDTDCNSGNVGCLLGIKNGMSCFDPGTKTGTDWRTPVNDRIYLPTADGGRSITDAATEALHVVNMGRKLAGFTADWPKNGARFHFSLPGSTQGFTGSSGTTIIQKNQMLKVGFSADGGSVTTPTFIQPEELNMIGYSLLASPTLYPGQIVKADFQGDVGMRVNLILDVYNADDELETLKGEGLTIESAAIHRIAWTMPDLNGQPIANIGLSCSAGTLWLDKLTWDGEPTVIFQRPADYNPPNPLKTPQVWRRAWTDGVDQWEPGWPQAFRLGQNSGRGLIIQGTRDWADILVQSTLTIPLATAAGVAVRVQGLQRYYAMLLCEDGAARLVRVLDGETVLEEVPFSWQIDRPYEFQLAVYGNRLMGWINGDWLFDVIDDSPLTCGSVGLVIEEGHFYTDAVEVTPSDDLF